MNFRQNFENGYSETNGIRLYYEIYGEGKPLVLIHGGGSSGFFDFEETIKKLHKTFRLIVIDLQNHGKSDHRDIPETFGQDAKDIIGILENLGIGKASFFGFSNGGTTALEIARIFPERTEKIVAASCVTKRYGMMDGFFDALENANLENMPQYLKNNFLKLNPDPEKFRNMFEKDRQRMISFQDIEDTELEKIQSPVFLISGDRDVMKPEHIAEIKRKIPDSRMMILPANHGNYMMADENGNLDEKLISFTLSQIKQFLKS